MIITRRASSTGRAASSGGQSKRPIGLSAFALPELIVVLTVLFLLTTVFLPTLSRVRQRAQSERCLNNLHELTVAWSMYATANNDICCNNFGVAQTDATRDTWCLDVMDWSAISSDTNLNLLGVGQLAPYMDGNTTYFKCPADTYLSPAQVAASFKFRVRSYSMNGFFGQGFESTSSGRNIFNTAYRQFLKVTDPPQPSSMFLFLDEHPDSINDGYYDIGTIPTKWNTTTPGSFGDVPGSLHTGAGGFSFADGHAELHKWQDKRTAGAGIARLPVRYTGQGDIFDTSPFSDIHWAWAHSSVLFSNP